MPVRHEETNLISKAECNITCVDIFTRGLFFGVHVLFISVSFRVEHGAWHQAGGQWMLLQTRSGGGMAIDPVDVFSKNGQVYSGLEVITAHLY